MASIRRMALAALAVVSAVAQKEGGQFFSFGTNAPSGALQLGGAGSAPEIRVSADDHAGVKRAANNLATDFGRVLGGANAAVVSTSTPGSFTGSRPVIIVGTVKTALINSLVSSKAIDVSEIEGKWEAYVSTPLVDSSSGKVTALVIAGSDLRGTIYGIYDVSEQIGVSPWYWWADVVPQRRTAIFAPTERRVVGPPSVKFRGIFLNDEAPALTNWAAGNYPRSQYGNPFNSDFYARVFDLILRLKGNYLWPAMWNSMFYLDDTRSGPLANDHGIFMGTSHHEPMARADKEQGRFCQGPWDWSRNRANVQRFMAEGVSRSKNWFTIYTVGMRGSGDAASATLTSRQLEEIIEWQHSTLRTTFGANMSEIPLAWMMYKVRLCLGCT